MFHACWKMNITCMMNFTSVMNNHMHDEWMNGYVVHLFCIILYSLQLKRKQKKIIIIIIIIKYHNPIRLKSGILNLNKWNIIGFGNLFFKQSCILISMIILKITFLYSHNQLGYHWFCPNRKKKLLKFLNKSTDKFPEYA